ncbi:hypothetical protein ACIBPB_31175 [Micromonospora sp. NPDC049836]|uniref:hypothetical protein n=1 Tax=Micromonospora sp. NPDC049836 TaxID=3364274 RepID=UPI0037A00F3A
MMTVAVMHPARQRRLLRGWEPVQLIGRMRIEAAKDGVILPKTYLLVRLLFLWENHRLPLPGYYASLLTRILGELPTATDARSAA